MGSLNPVSTLFQTGMSLVNETALPRQIYGNYRDMNRQNEQAFSAYQLTERDLAEKANLSKRELELAAAEDERKRQHNLQRATATRKAAFGNQGIVTTDGSAQAVLLGMFQESDEERKYRERLDNLRRDTMAQDNAAKRRRNLLSLQNTSQNSRDNFYQSVNRLF